MYNIYFRVNRLGFWIVKKYMDVAIKSTEVDNYDIITINSSILYYCTSHT